LPATHKKTDFESSGRSGRFLASNDIDRSARRGTHLDPANGERYVLDQNQQASQSCHRAEPLREPITTTQGKNAQRDSDERKKELSRVNQNDELGPLFEKVFEKGNRIQERRPKQPRHSPVDPEFETCGQKRDRR
jgi:hypothetical protein